MIVHADRPQHACPGRCGTQVPRHLLACPGCWAQLPKHLQDAVTMAWRDRNSVGGPAAHRAAVLAATRWYNDHTAEVPHVR